MGSSGGSSSGLFSGSPELRRSEDPNSRLYGPADAERPRPDEYSGPAWDSAPLDHGRRPYSPEPGLLPRRAIRSPAPVRRPPGWDETRVGPWTRHRRRVGYHNPWPTAWHDAVTRPDGEPSDPHTVPVVDEPAIDAPEVNLLPNEAADPGAQSDIAPGDLEPAPEPARDDGVDEDLADRGAAAPAGATPSSG